MWSRLTEYWVYGGYLSGILLLALLPELGRHWSLALMLVFLQLPVYMLHQFEEHDKDRFRRFVNQHIGGGKEVLSHVAVFFINVPGVWGVNAVSFYLAASVSIGYGLIAIYLTLVNAVVHILAGIVSRTYNPGLITAALLFIPISIYSVYELVQTGEVGAFHHVLGLIVAIVIHVAIVAYVNVKKRQRA